MYIRSISIAVLALVLVTASPGTAATAPSSSWPVTNATPGNTNFNAGERLIPASTARTLHTVWSVPHVESMIASANQIFAVVADRAHPLGSVLMLAPSGRVLRQLGPQALDLTGTSTSAIGDRPQTIGFGNGRLVVADTTEVQAFDPASGRRLWRVPGGAQYLTIAGGVVYTGKFCENPCGVTNSYAIDLTTGRVRWVHAGNGGGQPIVAAGRLFQNWDRPNSTRIYDPLSGKLLGHVPATVLLGDASGVYAMRATSTESRVPCLAGSLHAGGPAGVDPETWALQLRQILTGLRHTVCDGGPRESWRSSGRRMGAGPERGKRPYALGATRWFDRRDLVGRRSGVRTPGIHRWRGTDF